MLNGISFITKYASQVQFKNVRGNTINLIYYKLHYFNFNFIQIAKSSSKSCSYIKLEYYNELWCFLNWLFTIIDFLNSLGLILVFTSRL